MWATRWDSGAIVSSASGVKEILAVFCLCAFPIEQRKMLVFINRRARFPETWVSGNPVELRRSSPGLEPT